MCALCAVYDIMDFFVRFKFIITYHHTYQLQTYCVICMDMDATSGWQ